MSCYVDDVIAVLDDAGVRRAVMIGYSMGGEVSYAVAAAHPERLAGIVGLDSVPDPAEQPEDSRGEADRVLAEGTRVVLEEMADSESEPPPSWLLDHLSATDPTVFAGAWEAFATAPPFWAGAARITVPTLFLLGVGEDEQERWELGRAAAAAMPDAEAIALPGLGHLQAFWQTGMSLPPIERFLARLAADGSDWR
jgi:pimeloyl-ACP methyl ester carboxylesterase